MGQHALATKLIFKSLGPVQFGARGSFRPVSDFVCWQQLRTMIGVDQPTDMQMADDATREVSSRMKSNAPLGLHRSSPEGWPRGS